MDESIGNISFPDCENVELLMDMKEPDWLVVLSGDENEIDDRPEAVAAKTMDMTPPKDDNASLASSPQFHTPHPRELILPFSSCNESPIDKCLIAASTPFQGQRISSTSSIASDLQKKIEIKGNTTFNLDRMPVSSKGNETFAASVNESQHVGEGTFIKEVKNLPFCNNQNATFDTKLTEKDSGSDIMESCTHLESSHESTEENTQRKPLRTIPQPKTSTVTNKTTTKKMSRLAPRMNTAAISRIQARSPGSEALKSNTTNSGRSIKKPVGTTMKARKSLLPPSSQSTKSNTFIRSRNCHTVTEENLEGASKNNRDISSVTPTKRKAQESPKRMGRSPKISGSRTAIPPRITAPSSTRSNSAPSSRLATASTRASRLQRPSGLKGPTSYSRSTTNITTNKSNSTTGSLLSTKSSKSSVTEQTTSANKRSGTSTSAALTSSGNLRKQKEKPRTPPKANNHTKCITALATLLDYVVNKCDGLSAPRLSEEKHELQKLVNDKVEINDTLSTRLTDLESRFRHTSQEYERTTKENAEKFEREIQEERDARKQLVTKLTSELENERQTSREQITILTLQQEDMRNKQECELSRIQQEWTNEYEKLQENTENKIQEELKERIKPYVNAKSEVESLTAVLDMKNASIHKLEAQCTNYTTQQDEVAVLNYKIEQLNQKNEDLSMQLQDKMNETRNVSEECHKLQRSMNEELNRSIKLRQHNEQLQYRINSMSPSPSPSFNPVFTTSPTMSDPPGFNNPFGSTPRNGGLKRAAYPNSTSASYDDRLTRSLSYNNENSNDHNSSL